MHIKAIECAHGVEISNKEEIVHKIGRRISNEREVLIICTSLNTWVAMNRIGERVFVPDEVVEALIELSELRERNA